MKQHKENLRFKTLNNKTHFALCQVQNGFRNVWVRLMSFGAQPGVALFLLSLVAIGAMLLHSTQDGLMFAVAPLVKLKKDGATGDNLKFLEDLEKRFEALPEHMSKAELEAEITKIKNDVGVEFEKRAKATFEGIDAAKLKEFLGDDVKGVRAILMAQGEAIAALKGNKAPEDMSIRAHVVAWHTRNKDVIAKIKSGGRSEDLPPLEIRAANSPMTPANTISDTITIAAGSVIRMGGEVFDVRRTSPTFWDYITKGRTGLETLPWVNKKVPAASGSAAFIGPGIAKPGVSFTLEVEKSIAKKIAVSMKVANELLDDIDGMVTFIQVELAYQLKIAVNTALMTGVESSTVPAGVQTFSLGFTTSGLSTVNPNNWDCCRAIVAQIHKAFINSPIVIFMNPIDTANMDMEKAISQGTYMGLNVRQVPGAVIVEDYNVPVGFVQGIAIDLLKTLIYKDFVLKFGWENADFTLNLVTAIAEMRIHSYHSENDAAGFVYDDLADIKSQIAAA